jgi:GDP-L-fucose synthase
MAIAVVGGTGLIGRHVVERLAAGRSMPVVATCRSRAPIEMQGVRWVRADLRDPVQASKALTGCTAAVICAGRVSTSTVLRADPVESILDTLRIVTNVLEACATLRLSHVVLVSSCTVYPTVEGPAREDMAMAGDPTGTWFGVGWMHRYLEKQLEWYVRSLARIASAVVLRPTLVYGPFDDFDPLSGHFLPAFVRKVVEREKPIRLFGNGRQTRNLIHARDLAAAVERALRPSGAAFRSFNVAMRDEVSVREILRLLIDIDGFDEAIVELENDEGGPPPTLQVSGTLFSDATGWKPEVELHEGLADLLTWYRLNHSRKSATS